MKKNEIVIAGGLKIGLLKLAKVTGMYSGLQAGLVARSSTFATARITENTIHELTKQWGGAGEKVGFLYADSKTKEVHLSQCTECEAKGDDEAIIEKLGNSYESVSKKGNIIGMWHTHPPANSAMGTTPSGSDVMDPTIAVSAFKQGALGVIVMKNSITLFPIGMPVPSYLENVHDDITTPRYGPDYRFSRASFQYGTFDKHVHSKTYWNE